MDERITAISATLQEPVPLVRRHSEELPDAAKESNGRRPVLELPASLVSVAVADTNFVPRQRPFRIGFIIVLDLVLEEPVLQHVLFVRFFRLHQSCNMIYEAQKHLRPQGVVLKKLYKTGASALSTSVLSKRAANVR